MQRTGRPAKSEADRLVPVQTWIPLPVYDELCRAALTRDVSISQVVRDVLTADRQSPAQSQ
jgi:hypothetical protein